MQLKMLVSARRCAIIFWVINGDKFQNGCGTLKESADVGLSFGDVIFIHMMASDAIE